MNIAIVGTGYVGLSNAVILAQHHEVTAVDIDPERVNQVNERVSPIDDPELEDYLRNRPLDLKATLDPEVAYAGADFVLIATPTDYDVRTHFLRHLQCREGDRGGPERRPGHPGGGQVDGAGGVHRADATRIPRRHDHLLPRVPA